MSHFSSIIANQIRFLIQSLNDLNSDFVIRELCQFVDWGCEGNILLLQTFLDHTNFQNGDVDNLQFKPDLLAAIFRNLLQCPNFSTVLCEAVRTMVISEQFITDFCDTLHLSVSEKLGIGLALADSENFDIRISGQNFCIGQIKELGKNSSVIDSSEQIQNIILFLNGSEGLSKHVDPFMQMLSLMELKEGTPLVLAPLLSDDDLLEARNLELFYGCRENAFDEILDEIVNETSLGDIISELGYGCTVDASHCNEVLSLFLPLTEATLSRLLGTIARTYTGREDNQNCCSTFYCAIGSSATLESTRLSSWNVNVLVDSINQLDPFPLHAICRSVWRNADGQLSFLRYAVSAPPEIFMFAHSSRKLAYANELSAKEVPNALANHAWLSIELLEILCQLAERGHAKAVQQILELPLKQCPEFLLSGIAQINTPYNLLQYEVFSTVFPIIVGDANGCGIILQLWKSNPKLVLRGFIDMMTTDQGNIVTVFNNSQELKIMPSLLEQAPFYFGIRLAVLAKQKECIDLEKWLSDNIRTQKDVFFEALEANTVHITSEKLSEELKRLCKMSTHVGLRRQNAGNSDSTKPSGYSDDIEAEANSYFCQLFSGQLTTDSLIQMLTHFRESSERREQLIFECMIQNLFAEWHNFRRAPESNLNTAAILVGSLIRYQLVTHLTLGIALRKVLDALRKPPDTKIFAFGILAIEQFLDRLVEFPLLCNHILQIPHLRGIQPKLVAFIEHTLARTSSSHLESNGGSAAADSHSGSSPASLETLELLGYGTSQPGKQLSCSLPLQQRHQGFLVDKHIASTTSGIYSNPLLPPPGNSPIVPSSGIPFIQKSLQMVSSHNANGVPPIVSSSSGFLHSSRSLTSSWFNSTLNIETLVAAAERRGARIEAYEKGLMIAVIPFTSKILEACQSSPAYRPPNPWIMAILALLVEIYELPNLKMNTKFDIEVLFKTHGVDMKEVRPTSLLKDRVREVEGNPDFSNQDIGGSQPQVITEIRTGIMSSSNKYTGNLHSASSSLMEDENMPTLSLLDRLPSRQGLSQVSSSQSPYSVGQQLSSPIHDIGSHIIFNNKLSALGLQYFQRIVPLSMEKAIKEVMSHVVQYSLTTAIQTTTELVLKDYAMESDKTRVYNAAHLMVASLAGSLAHVTCKEPLRVSISSQLRNSLQSFNIPGDLQEQAVDIILNDNLDLGCAVIERAATDKALKNIDIEITQKLSLRRKHKEAAEPSYYDASIYTQGPLGGIPEALRPRPCHLSHSQQRVYEFNPRLYSSGLGSLGLSSVAQPMDPIYEKVDLSSNQLHGVSSARILATDGVIPHDVLVDNVASLSSTSVAIETCLLETSNAVKELEETVPQLPANSITEQTTTGISRPLYNTGDALEKYQIVAQKLETLITKDVGEAESQGVIAQIPEIILKCISRDEAALAVAQKVFKRLYENASNSSHVSAHILILAAIRDVCKLVVKELTSWVIYSDEERKFNTKITVELIRKDLLNLAEYNMHMTKLIDAGRNKSATEFAISLLQTLLVQDLRVSVSELSNLVDVLFKLASKPGAPDSLQQLVEIAKNPDANAAPLSRFSVGKDDMAKQSREKKGSDNTVSTMEEYIPVDARARDRANFHDQVSELFAKWYNIYELHGPNDAACYRFISQLHQSGYFNEDDLSDRFFYHLTELSVTYCLSTKGISSMSSSSQPPQISQDLSFLSVDVYAKLVIMILKYCVAEHGPHELLFQKILSVTVRVIQRDAEEKRASFNPRPYFRMFINWILDLFGPDPILDDSNFQVLIAVADAFHVLQPLKVPAFSFAWLELISHRSFMPNFLTVNPPKRWPYVQRLLVDLFKFMEPYLRNAELRKTIRLLYEGTLRVLLVLHHDFPEFLSDYHFSFCDVIPSSCIQMRNVILSAFPRNMRFPDPYTPNFKIDLLAEINQPPHIFSEVDAALKEKQMKSDVDEYLKRSRHQESFLSELMQRLVLTQNEAAQAGTQYNVPLINSLILYVGMQTIQEMQARTPLPLAQQMTQNDSMKYLMDPALDIFQTLIMNLDSEGRYLFLNAIANQLRYPNSHTYFFSFVLLYLFLGANQEIIQEQITKVLLERLYVKNPHPWGILVTVIELIKNHKYNFWSRSFTRCAPEIESFLKSISRSCGVPKPIDESIVSGDY
ncbi:transcription regulator [Actinidia rufa]|uniref:Transcription regulator n=1 Tax=Actinidia rufa TaxID=165716 RepID=A0A7J0GWN9_9ERIC|nr:transcription regulator [Actinidia rufa]